MQIIVNTAHSQQEGMYGTFHAFQQINAHQPSDSKLTPFAEIFRFPLVQILMQLAGMYVNSRRVNCQLQL